MDKPNADAVQNLVELLILSTLAAGPVNGDVLQERIERKITWLSKFNPGSFFPALDRLELAGWLDFELRQTEDSGPAKFYLLTPLGKAQLEAELERRKSELSQFVENDGSYRFKRPANNWN